jgi:nitrite reductase/ring-hydroxylating ferredoxin subunit
MADGFVAVAKLAELSPGAMKRVAVDGDRVLIANVEGTVYALRDICGHHGAPLSRGRLDGFLVECPLHYALFDIRTGCLVDGPLSADVPVWEVRIEDDTIHVKPPPA